MLVTTRVIDQIQVQQVCGIDDLNPAASCNSDADCLSFYNGATNPTCNSTTKLCQFDPFRRWCVVNQTDALIPNPKNLQVNVIARIVCQVVDTSGNTHGVTYSNYNAANPAEQYNYTVNVDNVLNQLYGSGEITTKFDTLVKIGADLRIEYNWNCNLDQLRQDGSDRYHCPIDINAHLLSKSSNTTSTRVVWFKEDNGTLTRRYQTLYGFRFRFTGTGGCTQTNLNSFLTFIAGGLTLSGIQATVMAIAAYVFHKKTKVGEPCDQIIPGGEKGEWVLSAWGQQEVVLNGKRKGQYSKNEASLNEEDEDKNNETSKKPNSPTNKADKLRNSNTAIPSTTVELPEPDGDKLRVSGML
eukprot:TRINITY_DN3295_c0_g1_i2.p1 TRINITY_DN3295_c0_g1~~TRINITY_DN3295_c0_g1_i2.p1  ORF type:complete len:355 (-),score=100.93 TRINITY_DN3295_c0_g1_i2:120-1184(-)